MRGKKFRMSFLKNYRTGCSFENRNAWLETRREMRVREKWRTEIATAIFRQGGKFILRVLKKD